MDLARITLALTLLTSCTTSTCPQEACPSGVSDACCAKIQAATCAARTDVTTCSYAPSALEDLRCTSNDNQPELAYISTFCGLAERTCLVGTDAEPILAVVCLGESDSGLGL